MSTLWYPFTPMQDWASSPQLAIERGEGNYLIGTDGRSYLDGVSSLWTNVHGHNHPELNEAIEEQLGKIAHSTLLGLGSPKAEDLANQLVKIAPGDLAHVFYSDSGSTAVEIALKQAYQYWQLTGRSTKRRFAHLDESYHGDTLGAVSVGGISLFHDVYGPLLIDTDAIPCPQPDLLESIRREEREGESLAALKTLFETKADELAAFIIEPLVQGAGGMLMHSTDYLQKIASLCSEHDVLLIADEVATGFGRTGAMFACEKAEVKPDFLCLAKGITGGYLPLAATLTTTRIFEAFLAPRREGKTFFHGHTYTGNALGCAVALANLRIFRDDKVIEGLADKVVALRSQLEVLRSHPKVGDIRQEGLMVGVELVCSKDPMTRSSPEDYTGHRVCLSCRDDGVILRNLGDVVVMMPPLSITTEEISTMVSAARASIDRVCS